MIRNVLVNSLTGFPHWSRPVHLPVRDNEEIVELEIIMVVHTKTGRVFGIFGS